MELALDARLESGQWQAQEETDKQAAQRPCGRVAEDRLDGK